VPSPLDPVPGHPAGRYGDDVLTPGWQRANRPVSVDHELEIGLVVEDPSSGFCGAIIRWENGLVVLEDRAGRLRSFPVGPGFWVEGRPVTLTHPALKAAKTPARTASGSVAAPVGPARVALPSRIYVEGRHDAELVEKVWGDDLRHEGVVVEYLNGIDDLAAIVSGFRPERGRRLGVLVDHLVPGSKEFRIAEQVADSPGGPHVLVVGHPFIDIWEAIKPDRIGLTAWPRIARGQDWKSGVCDHLGWPHESRTDIAQAWRFLLSRVSSWTDLQTPLLTEVERLIDFVTTDES